MEKNKIKRLLIWVVVAIILIPLIIFISGIFSTVDFKGTKQLADSSKAKGQSLYIPTDYTIQKKAEMLETKLGTIFITTLTKSDKTIEIIQSDKAYIQCKGVEKYFGNQKTCFFGIGDMVAQPNSMLIMWSDNKNDYQITTNDGALTDSDLTNLITSLNNN